MTSMQPQLVGAGIGLRLPHIAEVVATSPEVPFFEIHPETFLANPHATELLVQVAEKYPVSVHTVGVSIGSAQGVDVAHLARVRQIVDLVEPVLLSGHVAWSTHAGEYLNDLLPLPYNTETADLLAGHIQQVQDAFDQPYLLENPSSYIGFGASTMTEPEFLTELVARTGCRLLCDVSNVYLSAHNMGFDARRYLDAMPADAVAELHLGGFEAEEDGETDRTLLVDTHGTAIDAGPWELYEYAVSLFGALPTLIERDNEIPELSTLVLESQSARAHASRGLERRHARTG
jgi:uncharacterized protein (UPF0276 family)